MLAAAETNEFLKAKYKAAALVDGDKGKIIGLLPPPQFIKLCEGFLQDNIMLGNYVEFFLVNKTEYLRVVKETFRTIINPSDRLNHVGRNVGFLFSHE